VTFAIRLVHKAAGPTSADLVREAARGLESLGAAPPVSHGGTLDPFAEGLLVLLAGQATRLIEQLHPAPKVYVAEVAWGVETDTGDLHGRPVFEGPPAPMDAARVEGSLAPFLGWHAQVPPATSAKRIGGERAYEKAHRGEEVVLPPSRVFLHDARWLEHDLPRTSRLWLRCKGGFYVRSLVRDVGRALGCGAHVRTLRRLEIGPWRDPGPGRSLDVSGESILPWLPRRDLDDGERSALAAGRPIERKLVRHPEWTVPAGFPAPEGPVRGVYRHRLVTLLREEGERLCPSMNLRGGL
jgi:tRNA pseudouridine55 synthase